MPKKSSDKSNEPNIEVGGFNVGGNVDGNFIVGNNNVINQTPEQIRLGSLHQLHQPPADFTGREELIDHLLKDFDAHKGATISGLTGMGGIGKTALGLVAAHKLAEKYPDGQIFLDLKGTTEPLSAIDIARHAILSFEPTADLRALDDTNMFAAYQSVLHGKKVLLYLDNARSAEQIASLRPPHTCAMLVTSRWTFSLPGLQTRRVDVMSEDDAKNFLLELCNRTGEKSAELAKACAYLPLALRISGSFLQVNNDWSVEKYLTQINDPKKRLTTLIHSRLEADLKSEPDLLATFELSYGELSEEDRKHWRMLGVFTASFDWAAASAMWELEDDETIKLLGLLKRYSLLEYDENLSRYRVHDLLADYAYSKIEDVEEQEIRLKHASHYKDVLSAADDLYLEGGEKVVLGLRLFDLEWEHIRTGQAWAVATSSTNKRSLELCVAYPNAGVYVLHLRQLARDTIQWLNIALLAAREIGDRRGEGAALGNLGIALYGLGENEKGIGLVKQALTIFDSIESPNADWARNKLKEWGVEE